MLLPADTPIELRHQLRQAGFRDFVTADVLRSDWAIDLGKLESKNERDARLVIATGAKRAVLDKAELNLTDQLFRAIVALATAAAKTKGYLEVAEFEKQVWLNQRLPEARQARDVIDALRGRLPARSLIETKRHPTRYRLNLEPAQIELRP